MRRSLLAIMAVLAVCATFGTAETTPAELLSRAKAARAQAEGDLAETRQRHLAERTALAAELQDAYDVLGAARTEAQAAGELLRRLMTESTGTARDAALADRRVQGMIEQAASSAGVTVGAGDSIENIERAVWAGYQGRLDGVGLDLAATVLTTEVIGRDGRKHRVAVLRLGGFASYACGDSRENRGLLTESPDGLLRIVGPYVDAAGAKALAATAGGTLTHVPIDADGSLRDRAPGEPQTWRTWLESGGLFVYPIAVVGVLGLLLVLERIGFLLRTKVRPALGADTVTALEQNDVAGARKVLAGSRTPMARVLLAGVEEFPKSDEQREAAVESALLAEAPKLERSLSLLAALAGVAPLLGLLGTVSGMIATFDTISSAGTGNPRLLSGGISEALITTQLGLMVAIPLLLAHAGLRRWVERREAMLEHGAVRVLGVRCPDAKDSKS